MIIDSQEGKEILESFEPFTQHLLIVISYVKVMILKPGTDTILLDYRTYSIFTSFYMHSYVCVCVLCMCV